MPAASSNETSVGPNNSQAIFPRQAVSSSRFAAHSPMSFVAIIPSRTLPFTGRKMLPMVRIVSMLFR
jgi:hypothetical protein